MAIIHVECFPDEALVKPLVDKNVTHHSGKSRVFARMKKEQHSIAMVDEDPGSTKSTYEYNLKLIKQEEGLKLYKDNADNKIIILGGKLEDWLLNVCKKDRVDISAFGLPNKVNELHEKIHQRLTQLEELTQHLLKNKNRAVLKLQEYLQS